MKNKNVIIGMAVIIIIIIILLGIVIKQSKDIAEIKKSIGIESKEDNKQEKRISKEEFTKYIKQVDITTENWKDYFEITEETKEYKNNFGDITETVSDIIFKLNDKYYDVGELYNTSLEIEIPKDKALNIAGEIYNKRIIEFNNKSKSLVISKPGFLKNDKETITLDEIKCIRATGILYYLDNIPKEYWNIADDTIDEYINIDGQIYSKGNLKLKDFVEN